MKGSELAEWRRRLGYSQLDLMRELAIRSRQTISAWERPDAEVPRLVALAVVALEHHPDCRISAGQKATRQREREFGEKWAGAS